MPGRLVSVALIGTLSACAPSLALAAAEARPAAPWETAPFAFSPAEARAALAALPPPSDAAVDVLYWDEHVDVDAQHRRRVRSYLVYRVLTRKGVEGWSELRRGWAAWYQDRPQLRARVIGADGAAHELDPAHINEASPGPEPLLHSDYKILRAPLPATEVGALVEEEVVVVDREPFFAPGRGGRFYLVDSAPIRHLRFTATAPASVPLRVVVMGSAAKPVSSTAGGTRELRLDLEDVKTAEDAERYRTFDDVAFPFVAYTTVGSWSELAAAYGRLVDRQIATAPLPKQALERAGKRRDRREVVEALLAWVHESVRYTGVELGAAAIVPRPPTETLQRGFGDCKDLATLLVAALRQAGVPADVALLRADGDDPTIEAPGLDQFDHVIVHVGGSPELWIDPTDEDAPATVLPAGDQGRLALVANASTRSLQRIPERTDAENTYSETREVTLAELGEGKLVETDRATGTLAIAMREHYTRGEHGKLQEALESYVRTTHAGTLLRWETSKPRESGPFTLRMEAEKVRRASTSETDAVVELDEGSLFAWLPDLLSNPPSDEWRLAHPRKAALRLWNPYSAEIRYVVTLPAGFEPRSPPADETVTLGPARLTRHFEIKDGRVEAVLRLTTGPRRWTAEQVEQCQKAKLAWDKAPRKQLLFDSSGAALLAAGRTREAIASLRSLTRAHPGEALHRAQLAGAILTAGFGDAARDEARAAVDLDPSSAVAQRKLCWVLLHDRFGRALEPGLDRAGAIAACRRARDLDRSDTMPWANLGVLLERDAEGVVRGPGADIDGAIAEFSALRDETEDRRYDNNLVHLLLAKGDHAGARRRAEGITNAASRVALLTAVTTIERGPQAAIAELSSQGAAAAERRSALDAASTVLTELRRYSDAAAMLTAAAALGGGEEGLKLQTRAAVMRSVRRFDEMKLDDADPTTVVKRAFIAFLTDSELGMNLKRVFSSRIDMKGESEAVGAQVRRAEVPGLSRVNFADIVVSLGQFTSETDGAGGHRVTVEMPAAKQPKTAWLVVKEGAELRLLGYGFGGLSTQREAWRLLDEGKVAAAKTWLGWAREATNAPDDPLEGHPFVHLLRLGAREDAKLARLAAIVLVTDPAGAGEVAEALERTRPGLEGPVALQVDRALAGAYARLRDTQKAGPVIARLAAAHPDAPGPAMLAADALRTSNRTAEARAAYEHLVVRFPKLKAPRLMLSNTIAGLGDIPGARSALAAAIDAGVSDAEVYNNLAWLYLFAPTDYARAESFALEAAQRSSWSNGGVLHTLAAALIERDRPREAWDLFLRLADMKPEIDPVLWYVHARVAEAYGLDDVARAAYEKAAKGEGHSPIATSVLARARFAGLTKAEGAAKKP